MGEGGQGVVYEVREGNDPYALKWYFEHTATGEQRAILENLIKRGAPSEKFLWPLDLLTDSKSFGYIMKLRPSHYKSIYDMVKRKVEPSFHALCVAAVNLAGGFKELHSMGYSYRDINFGNVFFDPDQGDILICDNDNVSVDGIQDSSIVGTARFMAPEIWTGESRPSTDTDLFSLAVLSFYMFMIHHPLEGKREADINSLDHLAMKELYGINPVFIWDPIDTSNRPVRGYQDNAIVYWDVYPQFIRDLFIRDFTEGMKNPKKRIVEKVWQDAFVRLLNSIVMCPKCERENFFDAEKQKTGTGHTCWGEDCQASIAFPPVLKMGRHQLFLNRNTRLLRHHIKDDYDLKTPVGEVIQHPQNPAKWGIKNLSREVWMVQQADGSQVTLDSSQVASISLRIQINFGTITGTFQAGGN